MRYDDFSVQTMTKLKAKIRSLRITQEELSRDLEVSLPTLKRWLSGQAITISILKKMCNRLGISIAELMMEIEDANPANWKYTIEQEVFLAGDPACLAFFDHLLQGHTARRIQTKFKLSLAQVERYLSKLEKLNLIDRYPRNRIKLKAHGEPVWNKNGPLAQRFKIEILNDFLGDQEEGEFFLNEFLPEDLEQIDQQRRDLIRTVRQANKRAQLLPEKAQSYGTYILLKPYRWCIDDHLRQKQ